MSRVQALTMLQEATKDNLVPLKFKKGTVELIFRRRRTKVYTLRSPQGLWYKPASV